MPSGTLADMMRGTMCESHCCHSSVVWPCRVYTICTRSCLPQTCMPHSIQKVPMDLTLGKLYHDKILLVSGSQDSMDSLKVCLSVWLQLATLLATMNLTQMMSPSGRSFSHIICHITQFLQCACKGYYDHMYVANPPQTTGAHWCFPVTLSMKVGRAAGYRSSQGMQSLYRWYDC